MNALKTEKQKIINNYLSSIDLIPDKININEIKSDLKKLLAEEPAVRLNYKKEYKLNEDGSKSKPIEKLKSMTIIFTYLNENNIPIPVEETIIIG